VHLWRGGRYIDKDRRPPIFNFLFSFQFSICSPLIIFTPYIICFCGVIAMARFGFLFSLVLLVLPRCIGAAACWFSTCETIERTHLGFLRNKGLHISLFLICCKNLSVFVGSLFASEIPSLMILIFVFFLSYF